MAKLKLSEWAQLGELLGTVAVVISLVFVVFSVNQNTRALQATTDNVIFERHAALQSYFLSDPSMAAIMAKKRSPGARLDEIEAIRWERYQLDMLDIWATAYHRHLEGMFNEEQWQPWDDYFVYTFREGEERLDRAMWEAYSYGFSEEFWAHVGQTLFEDSAGN